MGGSAQAKSGKLHRVKIKALKPNFNCNWFVFDWQANITQHLQKLKALSSARQYIDNNGFPTRSMPADVRGARKRPLSPAGSVVSISSSESVDNNEMDYYEDVEVDIEFWSILV